jgi:hypothetical protein
MVRHFAGVIASPGEPKSFDRRAFTSHTAKMPSRSAMMSISPLPWRTLRATMRQPSRA